jgi:VIT1/CCC1 family predicted Fe2+/Mn2+ transporter
MSDANVAAVESDTGGMQGSRLASKLNWLRAAVLGANDGIVSTAGLVAGVAGATVNHQVLLLSGAASVVAGAISMAVGEYVSVSSQLDSERAELEHERTQLSADPGFGLRQLTGLIEAQGIDEKLARQVAEQLTANNALTAHARLELNIDPHALASPWNAALASMLAFAIGGSIPFAAIVFSPPQLAVEFTAVAVAVALAITGAWSARLGHASCLRAALRTVIGGILAMAVTYGVGALIGANY